MIIAKSMDTWGQLPHHIKLEFKKKLIKRDGMICSRKHGHGCGRFLLWHQITIDHIIPISMGGEVCNILNMQILCKKCHDRKTDRDKSMPDSVRRYHVKEHITIGDIVKFDPNDLNDPPYP